MYIRAVRLENHVEISAQIIFFEKRVEKKWEKKEEKIKSGCDFRDDDRVSPKIRRFASKDYKAGKITYRNPIRFILNE